MGRLTAVILMAVALTCAVAAPVAAEEPATFAGRVTQPALPVTISSDDPPSAIRVDFDLVFARVDRVCFRFTFEGDLLDPGDLLFIEGFGGFENVGSLPESSRTLCVIDAAVLLRFVDGIFENEILMEQGSVQVVDLQVTLLGVAAAHQGIKPGRGCGDPNSIHAEEEACRTSIRFVSPTPADGDLVTPPFTIDVDVKSFAPIALVQYHFYVAGQPVAGVNRETSIGYAFTIDGQLAQALQRYGEVLVRACAFSVEGGRDPVACTERTLLF